MRLETEHGTYEADSEDALMKLARAGKRKHAALQKEKEARRNQANLQAESMAYRILERFVQGDDPVLGWDFDERGAPYSVAVELDDCGHETIILDRPDGRLPWRQYGYSLHASVAGCAGTNVIFLRDNDEPHGIHALAVGSHEGVLGFARLPLCITPEWFKEARKAQRERMQAARAQQEAITS